jgi:hypothetical protein
VPQKQLIVIALATMTTACFGQRLEFGVKGGVPITEAFETGSFFTINFGEGAASAARRYTIGPMIGLRLPRGFSVEFDALYKRLGFDDLTKSGGLLFIHTRTTANSWDFPILAKFRFLRLPVLSPYVGAGVSFRHISGVSSITEQESLTFPLIPVTRSTATTSTTLNNRSGHGGVVGLGAEMRVPFVRISPEIRYTRWGADRNLDPWLHSAQNQVEVLVGIAFRSKGQDE